MIYDGEDIEEWKERAAIMEFDGGLTREQAEQSATVRTRPPTKKEAIDWIKRHQSDPHYCRECFRLWEAIDGRSVGESDFLTRRRSHTPVDQREGGEVTLPSACSAIRCKSC